MKQPIKRKEKNEANKQKSFDNTQIHSTMDSNQVHRDGENTN